MPATLEWGVGPDGSLVFASSMVGVDPRDRPRVTCPECDDVVTFKAGERGLVVPHVAHRSGSACAATNPETAAHFNAKMRLARVLGPRGALRLRVRCDFGHAVEADWHVPAWQRAEPEFRVDTRRPDVALFGEGDAVVGAIEVLHSHRVDRAKAADFAASGVPWVEIRAEHVLEWDGASALPVEASDRETRRSVVRGCALCPKPVPHSLFSSEEIEARKAYAAWYAEAIRRPLPALNIAAAYAIWRRHGDDAHVVAAKVCAPGAATRVAFASGNIVVGVLGFSAVLHALRLLVSSPKARPATIWIAGDSEGIDSMNAPRFVKSLAQTVPDDVRQEVADLLVRTGSVVVRAAPWSQHRAAVDYVRQCARDHAQFGKLETVQ